MAEKPIIGWIWPQDKPFTGKRRARRWNHLKDIFHGKGADIFIGRLDTLQQQPCKARWSRWADLYPNPDDRTKAPPPSADRGEKRYDFRTRRYRNEYPGMWSNTEWHRLDDGGTPYLRAYWDIDGRRHDFGQPTSRHSSWNMDMDDVDPHGRERRGHSA